eukprot:7652185-Ditylum_brightwellii.AAC.1
MSLQFQGYQQGLSQMQLQEVQRLHQVEPILKGQHKKNCQSNLSPDKTPDKTTRAVDDNLSCEPTTKSTEESNLLSYVNQHGEGGMYKMYPTEGVMTGYPFFFLIEASYKAYTKLTISERNAFDVEFIQGRQTPYL